ncbi:MAG: anaerobic ribonucleoside-triphosphate reductase activating protein [Terrimicrobiaceae bacterium]
MKALAEGPPGLVIGGLEPLTTVDYPGRLAAVIFCQGCIWNCRYCHNDHLRKFRPSGSIAWATIREFLKERAGFLEAVIFSGGEPLAQRFLPEALRECRDLGYLVGLHTAGSYPERLRRCLPWLNWVGMDIKAPLDHRYDRVTGIRNSARGILQSLKILTSSGRDYQIRTTWDREVLSEKDLEEIDEVLQRHGAPPTIRQVCRPREL